MLCLFRTVVRLGELDLDEDVQDGAQPQDFAVGNITVHEDYKMWKKTNDIAIIKIITKVTFTGKLKFAFEQNIHYL